MTTNPDKNSSKCPTPTAYLVHRHACKHVCRNAYGQAYGYAKQTAVGHVPHTIMACLMDV